MNTEDALAIVDEILRNSTEIKVLSDIQESIFRLCWEGKSYANIAEILGYESDYIKKVGSRLWQVFSQVLGKRVSKKNLHSVLRQYSFNAKTNQLNHGQSLAISESPGSFQDWGEAIHVNDFWGRSVELNTLISRWTKLI